MNCGLISILSYNVSKIIQIFNAFNSNEQCKTNIKFWDFFNTVFYRICIIIFRGYDTH